MNKVTWFSAICMMAFVSIANAQVIEMATEMIDDDGEQMRIMSFSTDDGFSMSTGPALVMPSLGADGGFSFGSDQFSLLNNSSIQKELNLVDEQVERLKAVRKDFRNRMNDLTSEMRSDGGNFNFDPEMIEKLKKLSEEIKKEKQEEIEGLLLPEQIERLKQIALQNKMKQQGTVNALGSKEVAEALGLDKEKVAELRKKSKELAKKVQEDIKALREQAREDLLDELSDEQREKLEELLGEKFEQEERSFSVDQLRQRLRDREDR